MLKQISALLIAAALCACSGQTVLNGLTSKSTFEQGTNITYSPEYDLKLDVYTPQAKTGAVPVVIFLYGGRWSSGKKEDFKFVGGALTSKNYVAVIPNLRLYPNVRFPGFIEDAARSVKWVRDNISQYGGDPNKIFVMGHSSGAHVAAMLALNEQFLMGVGGSRGWLRGMIGLSGPYDFMPITDPTLRDLFAPPERFSQTQPIFFTDGRNPPLLLMHGQDDQVVQVKNSVNLAASVARAGGTVETVIYPKMSHELMLGSIGPVLRGRNDVLENISTFIDKWANTSNVDPNRPSGITTVPLPS